MRFISSRKIFLQEPPPESPWRGDDLGNELPTLLRADVYFDGTAGIRAWVQLKGHYNLTSTLSNPDPNVGSLLYASPNSAQQLFGAGFGVDAGKGFEIVGSVQGSIMGTLSAKTKIYSFGAIYRHRTYHSHGNKYFNPQRDIEMGGAAKSTKIIGYDVITSILKISRRGNYLKIGYSAADGIEMEDEFHIFVPAGEFKNGYPRPAYFVAARPGCGLATGRSIPQGLPKLPRNKATNRARSATR